MRTPKKKGKVGMHNPNACTYKEDQYRSVTRRWSPKSVQPQLALHKPGVGHWRA